MSEQLQLVIEECPDCPRFEKRKVQHFLMDPNEYGWEYTCTKAGRLILPSDGINPPPVWCPMRAKQPKNQ